MSLNTEGESRDFELDVDGLDAHLTAMAGDTWTGPEQAGTEPPFDNGWMVIADGERDNYLDRMTDEEFARARADERMYDRLASRDEEE